MSRYARFLLTLLAIVAAIAGALGGARVAGAMPPRPIDVPQPIKHPIVSPLPLRTPHLPLGGSVSPSQSPAPGAGAPGTTVQGGVPVNASGWQLAHGMPPRPGRVPKLSQFLVRQGKTRFVVRPSLGARSVQAVPLSRLPGHARPMNSQGGTIVLTGDSTNYFENDITLQYGSAVYLWCENLQANDVYQYVIWPPDGSGPYVDNGQIQGAFRVDGAGDCRNYEYFNLSTPFNLGGSPNTVAGSAYPGVWTIAMYDRTRGKYDSEVNIVANSAINFGTYSDTGAANATSDYAPGSLIVVNATGLNSSHNYAIGWVYTGGGNGASGSNMPCEYTQPVAAKNSNNGVCFVSGATGLTAFGGGLREWWGPTDSPSTSSAATGTYDVELYDTTANDMVGHQQISIEPSTVSWTLTPYSSTGATPPPGLNYNDIFATDGLTDQSTTGLTYAAAGLAGTSNGDTLQLAISDPNGVVLTTDAGYPFINAVPTGTQAGGAFSRQVAFPYNTTYQSAFGPTQNPFAPNVLTAQLYDRNRNVVLGSKSFTILGYAANFAWTSGTYVNAAPGVGQTDTVVITNTGNQNYGAWNGDAIRGIKIAPNANYNEQLNVSQTSAVDSAGNAWTISQVGSGSNATIVATPNQLGVGLPVGGTLQFTIGIQIANGQCNTSPCYYDTSILPLHGVAYSNADAVSNGLGVLAQGVSPSSVVATGAWQVVSETATANMAARVADYSHLTYVLGTANAPTSDIYTMKLTLDNVSSPGNHKLMDVKIVFPGAVDINGYPPTIASSPGGRWYVVTNNSNLSLGGANVLELTCRPTSVDQCGISAGTAGTFTLQFPIFQVSYPTQEIAMTANFDGGGCGTQCTSKVSSYQLGATTTTVNGIAGLTNIDSLELGSFSLNPNFMTMSFQPSTVGTGSGSASGTLVFTNTNTSQDPNPDYVDRLDLTFPSGYDPSSITVPSGWYSFETAAGSRHWVIALCGSPGPTNATPCSTNETSAIAPGGQLSMTVNWNYNVAVGTQNVGWYVTGANGGEDTSALGNTTPITFTNTTASVAFTTINGAAVPNGVEPQVGADAANTGSTFVYTIKNTGASTLNGATVTIPATTRSGSSGSDGATGNNGYFDITATPTLAYSGGGSGCSVAYTNVSSSGPTNGNITLTGCSIPPGGSVAITFVAQTPYLVGTEFVFPATIKAGATSYPTQTTYSGSNVLAVVLNATLTIITPSTGWVAPTQPNSLVPATGSGANPQTNCVSCQVLATTPTTLDFGVFNGSFTATDVLDASVRSDASSPNSWVLYVTTSPSSNPGNMLATNVDAAHSSAHAGFTVNAGTSTTVAATSPGLQLSTYGGSAYHLPIDSIMSFGVATGGNTSPQAVTLTYTLVFN